MGSLEELAKSISPASIEIVNRVMDTWKPLLVMAHILGEEEWLQFAYNEMRNQICFELIEREYAHPASAGIS